MTDNKYKSIIIIRLLYRVLQFVFFPSYLFLCPLQYSVSSENHKVMETILSQGDESQKPQKLLPKNMPFLTGWPVSAVLAKMASLAPKYSCINPPHLFVQEVNCGKIMWQQSGDKAEQWWKKLPWKMMKITKHFL